MHDVHPSDRARRWLAVLGGAYLILVATLIYRGFTAGSESGALVLSVLLTLPWSLLLSWTVGLVASTNPTGPWMGAPLLGLGAMMNVAVTYVVACHRPRERR